MTLIDIPNSITDFHGEYYWLDNMWLCSIAWGGGIVFNSVEQGFVYFKTVDPVLRKKILRIYDPYEAKAFGRNMPMREDWDEIKFMIMAQLVEKKFYQNPRLTRKLLLTDDKLLIEGNTWDDNVWGDCVCTRCRNIPGQNWLGRILMGLRAVIREA